MDQSSPASPKAKRLEGPGNMKPNGPKKSSQIRPRLPLTSDRGRRTPCSFNNN